MAKQLLSNPTYVESPFVIVKIGKYTFGQCKKAGKGNPTSLNVTYPNYMYSISATKVNGTVNTYTITMKYQIQAGDDPNKLEKVFSSISDTRKIIISYGDWNSPTFIYKEEEAIISKITSNTDFANGCITYVINCVSQAQSLRSTTYNFERKVAKPSDVIKRLFTCNTYRLKEIFYGMKDASVDINTLIDGDDKTVEIEAKSNINILDYLVYLVQCMTPLGINSTISGVSYKLSIFDDITGTLNGPYITIRKCDATRNNVDSYDTFEVDVGFPTDNFVTAFTLKNDEQWSILYKYSEQAVAENYTYTIDDTGNVITSLTPSMAKKTTTMNPTQAFKNWWNDMTSFPISATMTLKGLLRPTMLMSYVRINVLFYGQKHISSGLYVINKEEINVDSNGYKTTLSLTRVAGDSTNNKSN